MDYTAHTSRCSKHTSIKSRYYTILPFIFILCPTVPALLPGGQGEQIIFLIEVITALWLLSKDVYRLRPNSNELLLLFYFTFSILLDLFQDIIKGVSITSDFFELAKPLAFILFYSLYRYSKIDIQEIEKRSLKVIKSLFIILAIWSIIEISFSDYFLNISYWLYRREEVSVLKNKAIGSFAQTYQFAFILLLPLTYLLLDWLKSGGLKKCILFLLLLTTLLLTQSKSMYVSAGMCIILSLFVPALYRNIKNTIRIILLMAALIISMYLLYILYEDAIRNILSYALTGFELMLEGNSNSLNTRTEQLIWALQNNQPCIIGGGIGKGEMMLESFYALYYYRYGLLGLFLYVLLILITSFKSFRIAKHEEKQNINTSLFYYSMAIFFLISPMALSSSCHQDTPKIAFIFYSMIGLINNKFCQIKKGLQN